MNSKLKTIIVVTLILSLAGVAALYAQQAPTDNAQGNTPANYSSDNSGCRLNGGSGMSKGMRKGQSQEYSMGYGKQSKAKGAGKKGCNNQAMLQAYGKYADNPEFAKMLQEKDAIRQTHQKEALTRRNAHRTEMRNITLSYASKLNSAKTEAEKAAVTAEMNKAITAKRTADRASSTTFRNAHRKQMTELESRYTDKFPDYFNNRNKNRKGTGSADGRGSGKGKASKGCAGCK